MERFYDRFKPDCSPVALASHTIVRKNVRISVLTPCLLRVETQSKGKFCDEPTQSVWFRDFCQPEFKVNESSDTIEIKTTKANFLYSFKTQKMIRIKLRDGRIVTNYTAGNLKGTCRTLDITAGLPILGDGVVSRNGVALLDDSETLILKEDGSILIPHLVIPKGFKTSLNALIALGIPLFNTS